MSTPRETALELVKEGQALDARGDQAGALACYDKAFKLDLTNVAVLRELGRLSLRMGDLDRAQKTFRALLLQRLDADAGITKADAYAHLAEVHVRQGDGSKAAAMLARALDAEPQHAAAKALLAKVATESGRR